MTLCLIESKTYHFITANQIQMHEQSETQQPLSPRPKHSKYDQEYQQAIARLKQMHADIDAKFNKLGELQQQFFHNQEKKFVKTFITIMDRLSSELVQATKATETIDKQINSQPQCVFLQKELEYFQAHRQSTDKLIKNVKEQILKQYRRHRQIQQQRQMLHNQLYRQTTREHKYNNKTKRLTQRRESVQEKTQSFSRPQTATMRQKSSQNQRMGQRNLSFQHKLTPAKTRAMSKIQTAMTSKQSLRPYIQSYRLQ